MDSFPKIAVHHSRRDVSRESFGRFPGLCILIAALILAHAIRTPCGD